VEAIYGAAGTVIVGLLALIGTRTVAKVQRQAVENEQRLREVELDAQIRADLRTDYDRGRAELEQIRVENRRLRGERDAALARLAHAERRIEDYLGGKEKP
jgi:predicted transcriptional regulator